MVSQLCGINSVVECQLPKLKVAGSNPVSRSDDSRGMPVGWRLRNAGSSGAWAAEFTLAFTQFVLDVARSLAQFLGISCAKHADRVNESDTRTATKAATCRSLPHGAPQPLSQK